MSRGAALVLRAAGCALFVSIALPRVARADPVTDLVPSRIYTIDGCFMKTWFDQSGPTTFCLHDVLTYGFSASLNEYGFTAAYSTTVTNPPAFPSFLSGTLDCVELDGSQHQVFAGNCFFPDGEMATVTSFFSPFLQADENVRAQGHVDWFDNSVPAACNCSVEHDFLMIPTVTVATVTPEPATLAMLAPGLLGLGVLARRRRTRDG